VGALPVIIFILREHSFVSAMRSFTFIPLICGCLSLWFAISWPASLSFFISSAYLSANSPVTKNVAFASASASIEISLSVLLFPHAQSNVMLILLSVRFTLYIGSFTFSAPVSIDESMANTPIAMPVISTNTNMTARISLRLVIVITNIINPPRFFI